VVTIKVMLVNEDVVISLAYNGFTNASVLGNPLALHVYVTFSNLFVEPSSMGISFRSTGVVFVVIRSRDGT